MSPGQTGFVPGTKWVCPRDKPRFSPYFTQWKPSLSLGQTRFVPGTFRGRRAAERVYVLKVYVPFSFPSVRGACRGGLKEGQLKGGQRKGGYSLGWHLCRTKLPRKDLNSKAKA